MYDRRCIIRRINAGLEAAEADHVRWAAEEASSCRSVHEHTGWGNPAEQTAAAAAGAGEADRGASSRKACGNLARATQPLEADTKLADIPLEAESADQALRQLEGRSWCVSGHCDPTRPVVGRSAARRSWSIQGPVCWQRMHFLGLKMLPCCLEPASTVGATAERVGEGSVGRRQALGRRAERSSRAHACSIPCPRWLRGLAVRGERLSWRLLFPFPFFLPGIEPMPRRFAFASHQPFSTQPARPLESVHDLGLSRA